MMVRCAICFLFIATYGLIAQNIDGYLIDAIRYSSDNRVTNARSAGLGFSYLGIINDLGAINYNPAGITLGNKSEISAGVYGNFDRINSKYYGKESNSDRNSIGISNIAISSPITNFYNPSEKYYIGISYSGSQSYDKLTSIESFNPNRSYVGSESLKKRDWTQQVGLSLDGVTFIDDSLNQSYRLSETGGLHELNFAIATELANGFSVGGSMNLSFGSYHYLRFLDEADINNIYKGESDAAPFPDLDRSYHTLQYDHNFTKINFNIGVLYSPNDDMRFTFNLSTPSSTQIEEYSYEEADVVYDNKDEASYNSAGSSATTHYTVLLPWSISLGYSYYTNNLTLAGAFQFKDYSYIEYLELDDQYLLGLNSQIPQYLRGAYRFGLGAEYSIPYTALQVRAGVTAETSPVIGNTDLTTLVSCGMSVYVFEQLRFDFFAQLYSAQDDLYLYDDEFVKTQQDVYKLGIGLTYRY
jgi:long-subunit fatty acid transport protein